MHDILKSFISLAILCLTYFCAISQHFIIIFHSFIILNILFVYILLLQSDNNKWRKSEKTLNLIWLIVPFGVAVTIMLTIVWQFCLPMPTEWPEYRGVVMLYALSIVLELAAEPFWLLGQANLYVRFRVAVEATALLGKIVLSALLVTFWPRSRLYAFGIAQLFHGLLILGCYIVCMSRAVRAAPGKDKFVPESAKTFRDLLPDLRHFDIEWRHLRMVRGFSLNCVLKQILTEGERYVMTVTSLVPLAAQGQFDMVVNLGSLAPRLVFSSVEDGCHLSFSQLLVHGRPADGQDKTKLATALRVLTASTRLVLLLGLTLLVFSQAYSRPLLALYAGPDRADDASTQLMRAFAVYVLLLAVNGVAESFYYSVLSESELKKSSWRMLIFSVVFVSSCVVLVTRFGVVGVVLANCGNMVLRIAVCLFFGRGFFRNSQYKFSQIVRDCLPDAVTLSAFAAALFLSLWSMSVWPWTLRGQLCHMSIGAVLAGGVLITVLLRQPQILHFLRSRLFWRSKSA